MATRCFVSPRGTHRALPRRHAVALAAALAAMAGHAHAQQAAADQTVTVSGRSANNAATVAGFGDVPLSRVPFSATVISTRQLQDAGIAGLGDITRLDAGTTDAYNAPGYWNQLAVRGFTLDNRFNYRRDGLPINAETVIATGNKSALELLKGASGIQAGTSAPGGLLNLVVKRPTSTVRSAGLEWTQPGTLALGADLGDRAGPDGAFGWRVNVGATRLDPQTRNSRGHAALGAAAFDLRLGQHGLLEAEFERSRQSEPSTPGFSLLGNQLPDAKTVDPRLNLNNQAWSLPVVLDGRTGSLRYTHALSPDMQLVAHAMRQRLDSDDRIAFPFGCSNANDYTRYCADGSFDLYDFRSESERRTSDAADLSVQGRATLGGTEHRFNAGVLATRFKSRFNRQAYNWVGYGLVDGSATAPADPSLTDDNTDRSERSTELHLQDAITFSPQWQLWAGLRHTRLQRDSVRTDGSRATAYAQAFTTPWLAVAWQVNPQELAYASWGQGIESEVTPNRQRYVNAGQALPALKSHQLELGFKHHRAALNWQVAAFDIRRPASGDVVAATGLAAADCSDLDPCLHRSDGQWRHTGIEAEAEWRSGALSLRGSAMALRARREGAVDSTLNGHRPTNVPAISLKLQSAYNLAAVPGLALLGFVTHEGQRMVLPDNSVETPGWTRVDVGLRYAPQSAGRKQVWRVGVDNLFNQRAWKEAPYQYGHAYLYPLAPRTVHASLQLGF